MAEWKVGGKTLTPNPNGGSMRCVPQDNGEGLLTGLTCQTTIVIAASQRNLWTLTASKEREVWIELSLILGVIQLWEVDC
jgi:hypothetical protein